MLRSLFPSRERPVERVVHIYFSGTRFIVAAMHQNSAGICYEQSDPVVVEVRQPADLGVAFRAAFAAFSRKDRDLSTMKQSDWPSFLASGLRAVKAFEHEYTAIQCHGLNPSNAVVRACRVYPPDPVMELSIAFNPMLDAEAVGGMLLRLAHAGNGSEV